MVLYRIKTFFLLAILNAILIGCGYLVGGFGVMSIFVLLAIGSNIYIYYKSDTLVAKMLGARPLSKAENPIVHKIIEELAFEANMPMPKLWIWETNVANACATGRNPQNASIVVTTAILKLLDEHELRGVLAHEISHITNYDILIATIASIIAILISYLFEILRWSYFFSRRRDRDDSGAFIILFLASVIIAPLLQLAIGRTREYLADESGARLSHSPLELASALRKIEAYSKNGHYMDESSAKNQALSGIFFTSPFKKVGSFLVNLFSTHPPTESRIKKLENLRL